MAASTQLLLASALSSALLHSLWMDAVIAGVAALVLALMTRASAASRHSVAMAFLVAMVLVPAGFAVRVATASDVGTALPVLAPVQTVRAAAGLVVQESTPIASVLVALWLAGVLAVLVWRLGGWRYVDRLDRVQWVALPDSLQARVDQLRVALRITRDVSVRLADEVLVPFTARLVKPVIWLPSELLRRLPTAQLEALLAHELAHVARLDWLWNGVQCVVEALLFFHPAAWWLGRRIRLEREHACDDLAVAACGDAIALAEALAHLEHHRHPTLRFALAATGGSLMQRITRLIAPTSAPARRGARVAGLLLLVGGALAAWQVGAGPKGVHIQVESSGKNGNVPDVRVITDNNGKVMRQYRGQLNKDGSVVETYTEDGVTKPITARTRQWLADVSRIAPPPAPPAPPPPPAPMAAPAPPPPPAPLLYDPAHDATTAAPAAPAAPASPVALPAPVASAAPAAPNMSAAPLPPAKPAHAARPTAAPAPHAAPALDADIPAPPPPPAPPAITDSAEFKSLLQKVSADRGVQAALGTPIRVSGRELHGEMNVDDQRGHADMRMTLRGPKGERMVHVVASRNGGAWSTQTVNVEGPAH
ncbi:cytochrome c oxidase assembly factor Coa1 family protein [Lysobacter sp. TY2-98]|uniref:cytochrome c oxidase assembly factor Coa1 family protein n=1 Tax=Lysobacter sp. TY2-98 TaxID=2290922 RepID=UPI0013B3A19E|nr:cytochrome c oxidase assembly factor Coa1 family protein [Lysobacter sp. TY2-98]